MKKITYTLFILIIGIAFTNCATSKYVDTSNNWQDVAVTEYFEVYVDTTSITKNNAIIKAKEKKVFTTEESRQEYIAKIKNKYIELGTTKKADKWDNFGYYIYTSEYDCANKRLRILHIEDYNADGTLIQRTTTSKKNLKWINVDEETIRDYTFFFVCDYDY